MISYRILASVLFLLSSGFLILASASTCINGYRDISNTTCICDPGFEGVSCDFIQLYYCFHGGTYQSRLQKCHCSHGFYGTHCEKSSSHMYCHNGGHFDHTSMTCECTSGWGGLECHAIYCLHGTRNPNDEDHCICDEGYEGNHCTHIKHDHCLNGGTYDHHHHRCSCRPPFTGSHCETDLHCINGGTYDKSHQKCSCPSGWTGPHCESIICAHGYPDNNLDRCICYNGYDGSHCAGIKRNHCLHGGHFSQSEMICKCYAGYYGQHCEIEPDSCYSQPCINGGTCYSSPKTFYCNCPPTFTGTQCEMPINPPVNQIHTVTPQPNQIKTNCTCPITQSPSQSATTSSTVQTSKSTNRYPSTTRYPTTASTPQVLMGLTIGVLRELL